MRFTAQTGATRPALILAVSALASLWSLPVASAGVHPLADVQRVAEAHASRRASDAGLISVTATAHRLDSRLRLAPCAEPLTTFAKAGNSHTRQTIGVRCEASPGWTLYVPVNIDASVRVVTLKRSLSRGEVLGKADLQLTEMPANQLRGQYLQDIESALGKALKRPAPAERPLSLGMLATPSVVKRGESVTLVANFQNIGVSMGGTALSDGIPGETIRVRNASSGKTVEGVVREDGSVHIQ